MTAGLFGIGLSGLLASQTALRTAGHNIANVDTPGYSRQSVDLETRPALGGGDGFIGTGVDVASVRRELDSLVLGEIRAGTSDLEASRTFHELASEIDNLLADPSGGLSPALQRFFEGWHAVAADPTSVPARQVLLSDAEGLVQRFHSLSARLTDTRDALDERMRTLVAEVNTLAEGIARINGEIAREEGAYGQPPNDLLDKRDELVRELSERIDVKTFFQDDGRLNVMVGSGQGLVTGTHAGRLDLVPDPFDPGSSNLSFSLGGATTEIDDLVTGGEIAGVLGFRAEVLAPAERSLGQIAIGLAHTMNEQHRAGQTLTGDLGADLLSAVDETAPAVLAHSGNTGAPPAAVGVTVTDPGRLVASDYRLERSGAAYRLTRLADGTVFTLQDFPGAPEEIDGLRLSLDAGAIADGDRFLLEPSRFAARALEVEVASPQALAAAAPVRATAALDNAGDAVIGAPRVNLPSHDLVITFDSPPATYEVRDATTGARLLDAVSYTPGAPLTVNGVTTRISGAPAAGDVFTVADEVSAADAGNAGTGTIALTSVSTPDPNLTDTVTLTFTSPSTFDVSGASTGTPATGVAYTPGAPISFNGWTVELTGSPAAGDVFTVSANANGIGDNRNALALAARQVEPTLEGERSTYGEVYGQLIASVGTLTRQADLEQEARGALLDQVRAERDALSGVNLDEEAASLLRFQQMYQASAQLITVADRIFQSLLAAAGR